MVMHRRAKKLDVTTSDVMSFNGGGVMRNRRSGKEFCEMAGNPRLLGLIVFHRHVARVSEDGSSRDNGHLACGHRSALDLLDGAPRQAQLLLLFRLGK